MIWHRVRGVLGISIVWAFAWLPLGVGLGLYRYWSDGAILSFLPRTPERFLSHMAFAAGLWILASRGSQAQLGPVSF